MNTTALHTAHSLAQNVELLEHDHRPSRIGIGWIVVGSMIVGLVVAAAWIAAAATLIARSWQLSQAVPNLADVPGRPASAWSRLPISSQKPVSRSHP